jgi:hypothetical protein
VKRLILLILLLSSITQGDLFAEINVFLFPMIEKRDSLTMRDIARIDCPSTMQERLYGIRIYEGLYRDGFIDRREIYSLMEGYANDIVIYGNAVKVGKESSYGHIARSPESKYSVKSGSDVNVIIRKKGIRVEIRGTALEDGERGDEIMIMIRDSRKLKGRIAGRKMVEVIL